ncbi:hypothetical protein [Rasiella sp. SM2506]|uniref:hypothetical protein n=1 Tax=Rasiella sp. SM2506 TaxID=3423914 RepID=UPI003D7A8E57
MSASLEEISGMETIPQSHLIWAISDSHTSATLFGFNPTSQTIEETIPLHGIKNKDWEDMATDAKGNLYIGDFGNNNNKRKDLAIYKIPSITKEKKPITVFTTTFNYEDQTEFPPKKKERNFDVESFIHLNNHFYLFTKNRSSHFDGTVKVYKLPDTLGHHTAKLISTYKTCDNKTNCRITSATVNFETGMIVLLSNAKLWLLKDYKKDDFFSGSIEEIDLKHRSQKESISFKDANTLYIADEKNGILGGNVYEFQLNK